MKNIILYALSVALAVLVSCTGEQCYENIADLAQERVGILENEKSDSIITEHLPDVEIIDYDKPLNLFLEIEAGRCDAAIVPEDLATQLLARNSDYASLGSIFVDDETRLSVVVPRDRIAIDGADEQSDDTWWGNVHDKVHRNLLAKDAFNLILGGLYTTVVIFIFAAILAILLGAFLAYMEITHRWPWLLKPLALFVRIVHEVPSVVLMMFFYYAVFAGMLHGTIVSIIALGIYASEPLSKIFEVHITQVGREQFEAARMLGLTSRQAYRYVILPQAAKTMLPLVCGELKLLLSSTSYAGYIAQRDLVKAVDAIRGLTFDAFMPLLIISLLYLILSWMIGKGLDLLYAKLFINDRTVTHK